MQDVSGSSAPVPPITFPDDLPIARQREAIARAISDHQVLVVAGETGSGKTTQLPKICLQLGRGRDGLIGHTQPRRLAARTVAQRIAHELGSEIGALVGYQTRFAEKVSDATAVKLMTDGILLAEMQRDRLLRCYDTIIIDEAHERSLNIDFLLGYLKRIVPRRPDLKLIITSATIDVDSFSRHFDDAPVIEVSGRGYPVQTHYLDAPEDRDEGVQQQIVGLVQAIDAGHYGPRGDMLVFLSGEREIRELARLLRGNPSLDVLPLYARLSRAEQNRVFELGARRGIRVVLATNVAETSVTVPGIRYVIDPGEARISRYSLRTKMQRLPIEPVSQASADQRRGRCGRVAPGVCLRLYSEDDFRRRAEFTDPEIKRTNLVAVVLQMLTLDLGEVQDFPFIDPPDTRMVRDAYRTLRELGAVCATGELTHVGRRMARLPVDPRLARMVLAAAELDCLEQILVIASALAIQDPRERPADQQQQADQAHARFRHSRSDFMAWLSLWQYYEEQRQALSQNQLRKLCTREFLSFLRMREWRDSHAQLSIACRQQGLRPRGALPDEENYPQVHIALLSGLLDNIAQLHEGREYLGSRNRKLQIFPGSSQARKRPQWLVAAEIVETSRVYARQVAAIDPQWLIDINPSLLKRHYHEPRWQPRSGRVMAWERLSLYGLVIADKRPVHYGPLAPQDSRELFIREALVAGRYRQPPAFLRHNQRLVRELEELESRTRRRDILVDEQVLFEFYDQRLPADICTTRRLQVWLKREPRARRELQMTREQLLAHDPGVAVGEQFPDSLQWHDMRFALSYRFEPGGASDGVSVTVPVALLNRVPRHRFDWLVPGLLREKCIQLVKGLPKEKRKQLVPVPDAVDRALSHLQPDDVELTQALAHCFAELHGIGLRREDWALEKLDDYYRMNVRVVDAAGALLEQGRDLAALVQRYARDTRAQINAAGSDSPAREGLSSWDFDTLPRQWRLRQAGIDILSYPALVDRGETVSIELCDYPGSAYLRHRLGVLRLLRLASAQQVKYLRKQLLRGNEFNLVLAGAALARDALLEDLIDAGFVNAMGLQDALPYTRAAFHELLTQGRPALVTCANELEVLLLDSLRMLAEVRHKQAALPVQACRSGCEDMDAQQRALFWPGFLRDTPREWLAQYPRYVKALYHRAERLRGQIPRDQQHTQMLQALTTPLLDAQRRHPDLLQLCSAAAQYRWLLEELRVSLFAQHLGTRQAVSKKRLQAQWQVVESWLEENAALLALCPD
ncbi:MAG: ATP-dependent RNA helicase HrpA [Halioglobus sp.]|nr:ATP-dependent RNA helicase HrpA [Halioglobus sp.]